MAEDELDSKSVANDCSRDANDIPQSSVVVKENVETLATMADGAFGNPIEWSSPTKTAEVCETSAIAASTRSDIDAATNLPETQYEIEKEHSSDSSDVLCGIGAELWSESNLLQQDKPESPTDCPDTAIDSVNDVDQIECELFENNSDDLQLNRTESSAMNTSQSIGRPAVLDGLEVNAFLDILADTGVNNQTEDKILHSNEIDDNSIQHIETIPERGSLNATVGADEPTEVHERGKIIFVVIKWCL